MVSGLGIWHTIPDDETRLGVMVDMTCSALWLHNQLCIAGMHGVCRNNETKGVSFDVSIVMHN